MIEISLNQQLALILAFIGIFPSIRLIELFKKTKISDYLLFGLFFLDGILVLVLDPIAGLTNILIFYQLHHITIDIAFLILFIHACRMIWKNPPKLVIFLGLGYFLLLFFLTLLWKLSLQPENAKVIFFMLPHSFSTYYPYGAGFSLNGVIIYSTSFRYLGEFFRIFSLFFLFYAYLFKVRATLKYQDDSIKKTRKIWLLIWALFLMHTITLFPWFNFPLVSLFLVTAAILIFYITIFIPEGLLLSSVQVTRILPLYSYIVSQSKLDPHNSTIESISTYLSIINDIENE
jgi:hypothetical protein